MNKTLTFAVLAGLFVMAGCATTDTTANTSAATTPITLEQAYQRASETRQ